MRRGAAAEGTGCGCPASEAGPAAEEESEAAIEAAEEGEEELEMSRTNIIARVDGIHTVHEDEDVRLAVKTHLAHFFDPATGDPLR